MSPLPVLETLETDRLILRRSEMGDAQTYRQLWTERDPRVPPHRRVDAAGRPTVEDIAAQLSGDQEESGPGLLAVERRLEADVIGYCGLTSAGHGSSDEPELAYELLRAVHGRGYATEAARAVVSWAGGAGYPRLWAGVWEWNTASRRVLEKLGFREVGRVQSAAIHGHSLVTLLEL